MPNFDQFERLTRAALAREATIASCASEMSSTYDANRPTFARGKSALELEAWLGRAEAALRAMFVVDEEFVTSDDNRSGKDLIAVRSGTHIELKSPGGKTDANVGIRTIAWALGDSPRRLTELMRDSMIERRGLWVSAPTEGARDELIRESKRAQMRGMLAYLSSVLTPGDQTKEPLSHFARCVALGITKLSEIRSSLDNSSVAAPVLLVADWDVGLQRYEQTFSEHEKIVVKSISGNEETARVSVKLVGEKSGRICEIYPHYKNSHSRGNVRIPASAWVETACFHVWIE